MPKSSAYSPVALLALLFVAPLMLTPAALSQEIEGILDLGASAQQQIDELVMRLDSGRDAPASRQAMMLKWLIELYDLSGQYENIPACYRKILSYYPYDVGSLNAYARFHLDRIRDVDRAEELLDDAARYAEVTDVRALDKGETYRLLARVHNLREQYDRSMEFARRALALLPDEDTVPALRILADSQKQAGLYDDAAESYLELIGRERACNREDINSLQLFLAKTTRFNQGGISQLVADAVARADARRRGQLEMEGAEVVAIPAPDGVRLEGTLRRGERRGAVLFVPDLGRSRTGFSPYAQLLFSEGVSSLSLDLRGHGGSRADSLQSVATMPGSHLDKLPEDIVSGFGFLKAELGLNDDEIVVVSAGLGCALVEKALHEGGLSPSVAFLSPTFSADDRDLRSAVAFHADRPVLIIYSTEDVTSARSFRAYTDIKRMSRLTVKRLNEAGHGLDTLRRAPRALEYFQDWITGTLASAGE